MTSFYAAVRSQADDDQDVWSDEAGISFVDDPGQTRQEFAHEADINYIMSRYGAAPMRTATLEDFKEVDLDLTLMDAYDTLDQAKMFFIKAPDVLKERFPTWQAMLTGMASGELARFATDLEKQKAELKEEESKKTEPPVVTPK